jgi:hypothetical protein
MENNVVQVRDSAELHDGARALVDRSLDLARHLLEGHLEPTADRVERGGRKAHRLEVEKAGP